MKEFDQLATSFITPFGMYCYVTMPFGLKNTGANVVWSKILANLSERLSRHTWTT